MQPPALPFLPGFNFDSKVGKTNFHRSQIFDKIHEGVFYLAERRSPLGEHSRYPSVYPYDDEQRVPPWIAYDGQRLMFKAFFQETVQERWKSSYQIRIVTITFFLEDGTMKIVEPSIDNSGLEQGVLVRRQRIPMPDPVQYRFYDIIDLNIGKEPQIFGRVYKIVDCDKFTRIFLNRMGIPVPDRIEYPIDPYIEKRSIPVFPKKPNRKVDTLAKFLKYDGKVLKFLAYWDDSESEYGSIHDLEISYYLADDTIEIKEIFSPDSGKNNCKLFLKRIKIPKLFSGIDSIGANDPFTVLNVLGGDIDGTPSYFIPDALNTGKLSSDRYYKDCDLAIGTRIDVFGRQVVIIDLDSATKDYYRAKYGLEEFKPLDKPKTNRFCSSNEQRKPPPYNGFGSYDDSLGNCFTVVPKPPKGDYVRFFQYDKKAYDSQVLRFRAQMISNIPENSDRQFIIRVYLMDNTVSIYEQAVRNTGFQRCLFQRKMLIPRPGQDIYTSDKPKYYEPQDFFIGACLNLGEFHFRITSADTYALRYMEINCEKFSKSNSSLIMKKIRESIRPVYKQFIEEYQPIIQMSDGISLLPYEKLKEALGKYLQDQIVEHEVITIARRYSVKQKQDCNTREYIRSLMHTELHRFLWNDLDRLEEDINHWDMSGSGYLPRKQVYTILRGCRLPADPKLLDCMLDHLKKNCEGKIDYHDLLQFLNVKINPVTPIPPVAIKASSRERSNKEEECCPAVNWGEFLQDLDIKEQDPASAVTH